MGPPSLHICFFYTPASFFLSHSLPRLVATTLSAPFSQRGVISTSTSTLPPSPRPRPSSSNSPCRTLAHSIDLRFAPRYINLLKVSPNIRNVSRQPTTNTPPSSSRPLPSISPLMDLHTILHHQKDMDVMPPTSPSAPPPSQEKVVARPYKCPYPLCVRAFSRLEHQVRGLCPHT